MTSSILDALDPADARRVLAAEGIEVIPIAGSELGTGRGGPRCMSCPVARGSA